ncbi:hypothetical protein C2I18_23365 [Paenibacillus sp. PK3_47]|uniref:hypothetical protein n=1 Tax=Paenibacillus sp. PK3_47 TaxID=2072642 RepID=UPI00201DA4B9|nr:hypothetical protein [Paenibacillus sp. PK3_47]UQZ36202.1 hypothetical protein C2I18_23365 [Paenibacillus sp. PK3_47]
MNFLNRLYAEHRVGRAGRTGCWTGLLIVLMLFSGYAPQAAAEAWDSALDEIHSLYSNYTELQVTLKSENAATQALRKQNNIDLAAINKQLQSTDLELLNKLKSEAEAVQKKHAPLLTQYSSLGKQASEARKAKNLKSATLLDIKRNKLKVAAEAAKAEVKAKTTALSKARAAAAAKVKPAKDALLPAAALKKQITAENKKVSAAKSVRSQADKSYKSAVKNGDAVAAAAAMKKSYAKMGEIRTMGQQIYRWEKQIASILRTAEAKLPK